MTRRSARDVARLEKTREQGNRIASANDRVVLALWSAGLAASFAFVRFWGDDAAAPYALRTAWVCWFLSIACLIVSFWFACSARGYANGRTGVTRPARTPASGG